MHRDEEKGDRKKHKITINKKITWTTRTSREIKKNEDKGRDYQKKKKFNGTTKPSTAGDGL